MAPVKVIVQGLPCEFRYNKEVSQEKNENDKMDLEELFVKYGRVRCVYLWPETSYVIWRKWEGMVPDNFAELEFENARDAKAACVAAAQRGIKFENCKLTLTRMSEAVAPIEKLEDKFLLKIFSMLDPANKLTIEKVCKRWRKLAPESWQVKSLDLGGIVAESERCLDTTLEQYLKRCGQYLEYITCDVTSPKFIDFIRTYCPGLRSLHMWIYLKIFPSDAFIRMIRFLRNLRQLEIHYYPEMPDIVEYLPKSMEKIYISYTRREPHTFDVRKFCDLRSLSLRGFYSKLHVIGIDRTQLTHLDLRDSFINESIIRQTSNLAKLRILNVCKTSITDEMLIRILRTNPRLEYLDISESFGLTDDAIREALWLPRLGVLKMMKLSLTLDIDFSMPSLTELHCEGCHEISNRNLSKFLTLAPELRYLDVRGTSITPYFFEIADSELRRRRYRGPLTIDIDHHKMQKCSYSSRISIINSTL